MRTTHHHAAGKHLVDVVIGMRCQRNLFQLARTFHPRSGFAHLLHGWQKQANENRNDRDHHQEFNQCERKTKLAHASLGKRAALLKHRLRLSHLGENCSQRTKSCDNRPEVSTEPKLLREPHGVIIPFWLLTVYALIANSSRSESVGCGVFARCSLWVRQACSHTRVFL